MAAWQYTYDTLSVHFDISKEVQGRYLLNIVTVSACPRGLTTGG